MTTHTITLDRGPVELTVSQVGSTGRPFLLLHGGAGPQTGLPFANLLTTEHDATVYAPVHPGFDGTPRPEWLTDVRTLARLYVSLLDSLELDDVVVIGNSIGGWLAAEIAALGSPRVASVAVVNGVGIAVEGHPIADTFTLAPPELANLAFYDPAKFQFDPSALTDAQRAIAGANRETLRVYSGQFMMADPTLRARLAEVTVPVLVAWGEGDQVVDADYGRAYAQAIPGAEFRLIPHTGHMPQVETPAEFLDVAWDFANSAVHP